MTSTMDLGLAALTTSNGSGGVFAAMGAMIAGAAAMAATRNECQAIAALLERREDAVHAYYRAKERAVRKHPELVAIEYDEEPYQWHGWELEEAMNAAIEAEPEWHEYMDEKTAIVRDLFDMCTER